MAVNEDASDRSTLISSANGTSCRPVLAGETGEGLPYAPEDWPNPGDTWKWKVGKRKSLSGFWLDRYLYLPNRLQKRRLKQSFPSKPAVIQYIRKEFPHADIGAFFASFTWKIPCPDNTSLCTVKEGSNSSIRHLVNLEGSEHSPTESMVGPMDCKAGNMTCSLRIQQRSCSLALMDCDICCNEIGFCRNCCCILCCRTIDWEYGGYSYVRCEARVDENYICGHVAHMSCALRSYMAGTVGGGIGLDSEYYCRRCDNRTDLISHVATLLHTCESINSQDDVVKILNLGLCILHGTRKTTAKSLLSRIEMVLTKLQSGVYVEEVWKMDDELSVACTGERAHPMSNTAILEQLDVINQDILDLTVRFDSDQEYSSGTQMPVSITSDQQSSSLKLEKEIDWVLQSLKRSQESEYRIAEQKLYAQKDFLFGLYPQLDVERAELAKHRATPEDGDSDTLLANVLSRVDQIKQEVVKLRHMMEIAKGFGKTPRSILREHFGLPVDD